MDRKTAMQTRIVGIYNSHESAAAAKERLLGHGIGREHITISHLGQPGNAIERAHSIQSIHSGEPAMKQIHDALNDFFHSVFDRSDADEIKKARDLATLKSNIIICVDTSTEDQADRVNNFMRESIALRNQQGGGKPGADEHLSFSEDILGKP